MPISLSKYKNYLTILKRLKKAGRLIAARHLQQLEKTIQQYYSSPYNDQPGRNLLTFTPIRVKIAEIELYLSSFSRHELKNPQPSITFSQQTNYPPITQEDLDIFR